MANKDKLARFNNPISMSKMLSKYVCNPERLYYTFKFLTYSEQDRYKNVAPLYRSISKDNVQGGNIVRRVQFAEYILANKRIDLVFDVFAEDDLYLADTLKLIGKLGLTVNVEDVEVVD
jgi:hypothetical protein